MDKFYYTPGSCSLATHIALEEAGASYEAVRIDFGEFEQRSTAYLAINPKGRVPAQATERGILTETPALLAFVAQRFPGARLAPLDDPFAFARIQSFDAYLCATAHVAHAHKQRGARWVDDPAAIEAMRRKIPEPMTQCFELIEQQIGEPWVMGESYTICDPYLFTVEGWLASDGVDIARFPKANRHYQRMLARPAVAKVLASLSSASST